jgi:hypothetical protein
MLISLASSSDAAPNFWLNPQNGVSYRVSVQTPQYRIDSLDALTSEPMVAAGVPVPELLTNLAQVERGTTLSVANHYNIQNVFDVYANVQDRDLAARPATSAGSWRAWRRTCPAVPPSSCAARCRTWTPPFVAWPAASSSRSSSSTA